MSGCTHQTTADEQHGNGNVLQVLRTVFAIPIREMLEEDVRCAVCEDQGALNKLG
jgi:hypothetical protein